MNPTFVGFILLFLSVALTNADEKDGVRYATNCEVCKIVTNELDARLRETGKSFSVIETGYNIEAEKKKVKYQTS